MLDLVVILANTLIGLSLLLLGILSLNFSIIVSLHLFHRRRALVKERALMATPLPPPALLPRVVVQLPVYNERNVIDRLIEAAAGMDWPQDRLEIQVLDDSTDDTTELARGAVERVAGRGFFGGGSEVVQADGTEGADVGEDLSLGVVEPDGAAAEGHTLAFARAREVEMTGR